MRYDSLDSRVNAHFGESLLDVAAVAVDLVALHDHALVDAVVVVKGDEGEAAVLVRHLLFIYY